MVCMLSCILVFAALTVTPVTIGLQLTQYSVIETEDYQFVCATVQSGDVAGRDFEISYVVEDYGMIVLVCAMGFHMLFYYSEHCDSEWYSALH